jgi:integrase
MVRSLGMSYFSIQIEPTPNIGNSLLSSCPNVEWVPLREIRLPDFNYGLSKVHLDEIFNSINWPGTVWGPKISENLVRWMVRQRAEVAGIQRLAPHNLRRTCARLCHTAGGGLEQIQFLLRYRSIETTERHLRSRQRIVTAVNDKIGLKPNSGEP